MSIAVQPSARAGAGSRNEPAGSPSSTPLRRAPVLLRLPALDAPAPEISLEHQTAAAPMPPLETPSERPPYPAPNLSPHPAAEDFAAEERASRPTSSQRESRRERTGRSSRGERTPVKATPSQWMLGGGMLAAGVVGFFVLSGDFSDNQKPPADGWSQRSAGKDESPKSFAEPQFAQTPPSASRESGREASEGPWTNPADGAIAERSSPADAKTPAWQPGGAFPKTQGAAEAESKEVETASRSIPETGDADADAVDLAPPGNGGTAESGSYPTTGEPSSSAYPTTGSSSTAYPTTGAPPSAGAPPTTEAYPTAGAHPKAGAYPSAGTYPSTNAAGLNPPSPPPSLPATANYPTTGYHESLFPAAGAGYGPAAYTGMRDRAAPPSGPGYQSGYPGDVSPPAMSPRYERIR